MRLLQRIRSATHRLRYPDNGSELDDACMSRPELLARLREYRMAVLDLKLALKPPHMGVGIDAQQLGSKVTALVSVLDRDVLGA